MSDKFNPLLAACAVATGMLAAATPAVAKEPITVVGKASDVPVRYVSYRDLNLATASGEKRLIQRVRYAANDVCDESIGNDLGVAMAFLGCRTNALRGAQPQIDRAVLRAREIARSGWSAIAPVAIGISAR